jgi:hypothetical protein
MMLDDYVVPSKNFRVTMTMEFDSESLGAQTSATDSAHKGIKPKIFNVGLTIPFVDAKDLSELITIAQATRVDGSLHIYDIVEQTANAVKVRQVRFSDSFAAREDSVLQAWNVQFSVTEYLSVPEKTEQRTETSPAAAQSADGEIVSTEEPASDDATPKTGFEKLLYKVEKSLS